MKGLTEKIGPMCFFCKLEGYFKSDCPQFWDAMSDNNHPNHEEALSGVKAYKAGLTSGAEARRKEKPQELATKKMQAVVVDQGFKIYYKAAAKAALIRAQKELATREIEQKIKLELEIEKTQYQLNAFEALD